MPALTPNLVDTLGSRCAPDSPLCFAAMAQPQRSSSLPASGRPRALGPYPPSLPRPGPLVLGGAFGTPTTGAPAVGSEIVRYTSEVVVSMNEAQARHALLQQQAELDAVRRALAEHAEHLEAERRGLLEADARATRYRSELEEATTVARQRYHSEASELAEGHAQLGRAESTLGAQRAMLEIEVRDVRARATGEVANAERLEELANARAADAHVAVGRAMGIEQFHEQQTRALRGQLMEETSELLRLRRGIGTHEADAYRIRSELNTASPQLRTHEAETRRLRGELESATSLVAETVATRAEADGCEALLRHESAEVRELHLSCEDKDAEKDMILNEYYECFEELETSRDEVALLEGLSSQIEEQEQQQQHQQQETAAAATLLDRDVGVPASHGSPLEPMRVQPVRAPPGLQGLLAQGMPVEHGPGQHGRHHEEQAQPARDALTERLDSMARAMSAMAEMQMSMVAGELMLGRLPVQTATSGCSRH